MKFPIKAACLLLILLNTAGLSAQNAKNYVVNASLSNKKGGYVKLFYNYNNAIQTDSIVFKDGLFSFNIKGEKDKKAILNLYVDNTEAKAYNFYLDKDTINIKIESPDELPKVDGGALNAQWTNLQLKTSPFLAQFKEIDAEYYAADSIKQKSEPFLDALLERSRSIKNKINDVYKAFIKENPTSQVSPEIFLDIYSTDEKDGLYPYYKMLPEEYRNDDFMKIVGEDLSAYEKTAIGNLAPDFKSVDSNGKPVTLSNFRGKYVLLDFWASWCVPCRRENPEVVKAYAQWKDKKFTVISVSIDVAEGDKAWRAAFTKDKLVWTNIREPKIGTSYSVSSIPQNFLIDPNGKIIAKELRGKYLHQKLEEILK